jgi:FkbM family methyltransferase
MPTRRQKVLAAICRRYPFFSGAGSLANSQMITKLAGITDEEAWCPTAGGEIWAPLNDYVGRAVFFCGDLDPKISWVCKRIVRPGSTVCDIGANIGLVTMLLSSLVGPNGHVLAFEPNPVPFARLQTTIARNDRTNVTAFPMALGAQSEQLALSIPTSNSGAASLKNARDSHGIRSITVPVCTLDEIASQHAMDHIDFMKVDVEGFEAEVFKGSTHVLQSLRPDAILFEMNDHTSVPLIEHPVFSILDRYGYQFLSLPRRLMSVRLIDFDPRQTCDVPGHDVLAIAKGPKSHSIRVQLRVSR